MKLGDVRQWLTEDTWAQLDRVINMKSDYMEPYYIQIQLQKEYRGPATANADLRTEVVEHKASRVMGRRMMLFNCPLKKKNGEINSISGDMVCKNECSFGKAKNNELDLPTFAMCPRKTAQLGTILVFVDNKKGIIEPEYVLPLDTPNAKEDSDNSGKIVPLVAESVSKRDIPLVN